MRVALGASGTLESAAAPDPVLGASLALDLAGRPVSFLSLRARVGGLFAESGQVITSSGAARFRLLTARAQLCSLNLTSNILAAHGCVILDLGYLRGRGYRVQNERTQLMPWLAPGAALGATVATTRQLGLLVEAGARRLIVHNRFIFEPGEVVHQVPAIAWHLGAGLQWELR